MKKVSVITIIDNNNFGTFLQAFALCKAIESLGYKPELVNYCRPYMKYHTSWWQMCKDIRNPLRILSRTSGFIRSYILHKKNLRFISQFLTKKKCYSVDEIKTSIPPPDIYMTGSDQVWNTIHNHGIDYAFFLDYAPETAKKVAYAASIGMESFQEDEKAETKRLLERYSYITLREESSIDLLQNLGIDSSKLQLVLDPTLLLNKEQWAQHISRPRLHDEKYLLVYSVETKQQDAIISEVAKKVAKEKGLKIVGIYYGGKYNKIDSCDYNHYWATPDVFLSLIYHADFVVASSFHGTVFSINFEKDFLTVIPERFNTRINNILSITGLESRLLKNLESEVTSDSIDYYRVARNLDVARSQSNITLSSILQ